MQHLKQLHDAKRAAALVFVEDKTWALEQVGEAIQKGFWLM